MKCPMTAEWKNTPNQGLLTHMGDCLKKECAWYRPQAGNCVLYVLVEDVRNLRDTMRAIKDNMPVARE